MAGGLDNALENERNKLDNQLSDVMSAIGNAAAHDSEAAKVWPELSNAVEPATEQSRRRYVRPDGTPAPDPRSDPYSNQQFCHERDASYSAARCTCLRISKKPGPRCCMT
jgi:hypothetical protein